MRSIGLASLVWGVGVLLSRVIGLVRESVIGRTLGAGGEADVYWSAFVLPDFLNYLLAGGVLSLVFIPIFQAHLARGDEAGAWRSFSVIGTLLGLALLAGTAAMWWGAPWALPWIFPGLGGEQLALLTHLVRIILPAQIFHLLGGLVSATLQARDRHLAPAMAPLLYTASIIGFGLALGPTMGAVGFAWGVLVGAALGSFGLPVADAILRGGLRYRPSLAARHPDVRRYLWFALPVMLGFSVVVLDDMLVKRYGSLVAVGVVARLQYAKTLMKVPMGVFGFAVGAAAYPTLTRLVAEGARSRAFDTLHGALRAMLVLAFLAQAALTVAGVEIATVIWGTGRFTPEALGEIGLYTGIYCLGLWAWAAQGLIARGFYANGNFWLPTLLGTLAAGLAFPLYGWMAARWGGVGLAAASSAAITLYVIPLAILLRRRHGAGATPGPGLADAVLRLGLACGLGVAAGTALRPLLPPWPALLNGALLALVAVAVCAAAIALLRVPEIAVLGRLARRLTRSQRS